MSTEKELREMLEEARNVVIVDLKLREKAEKWDKVTEYLEITHSFLECDESIVMDVLKKGTERRKKLEAVRTHVLSLRVPTSQWWRDLVRNLWDGDEAEKILEGEDLQNIGDKAQ